MLFCKRSAFWEGSRRSGVFDIKTCKRRSCVTMSSCYGQQSMMNPGTPPKRILDFEPLTKTESPTHKDRVANFPCPDSLLSSTSYPSQYTLPFVVRGRHVLFRFFTVASSICNPHTKYYLLSRGPGGRGPPPQYGAPPYAPARGAPPYGGRGYAPQAPYQQPQYAPPQQPAYYQPPVQQPQVVTDFLYLFPSSSLCLLLLDRGIWFEGSKFGEVRRILCHEFFLV
jgi:hypothetical protein